MTSVLQCMMTCDLGFDLIDAGTVHHLALSLSVCAAGPIAYIGVGDWNWGLQCIDIPTLYSLFRLYSEYPLRIRHP